MSHLIIGTVLTATICGYEETLLISPVPESLKSWVFRLTQLLLAKRSIRLDHIILSYILHCMNKHINLTV